VVGHALHLEGSDAALTIASAAPVDDGPGWRVGFREVQGRAAAEPLRDQYLEVVVDRDTELAAGQAFWHEVIGAEVKGVDGNVLGTVADVYRAGEAEVYIVRGGPVGEFDLPAVRTVIRDFAPERGEIVIDEAVLDLAGPAVEQEPRRRRRHRFSRHGTAAPGTKPPVGGPATPASPEPKPTDLPKPGGDEAPAQ
jgi:ribosomal 30S subunit maturation factor RimM